MINENIKVMVSFINNLPHKQGVSRTLSPSAIVRGKTDCNSLHATFGAYSEVHIGTTNSTEQRKGASGL